MKLKKQLNKWNKQGVAQDQIFSVVVGILVLLIFAFGIWFYLEQQNSGASVWEDYYAKELSMVLNSAKPGDTITLDVHQATKVAQKHNVDFNGIFSFPDQEVCVKLSSGRKTCQRYFNSIRVGSSKMRLGVPGNVLDIKVTEKNEVKA